MIDWYKQAFFRYFLQLADKRASIKENSNVVLKSFNEFKLKDFNNKNFTLRTLQNIAIEEKNNQLLILRAATGAGKSLACLLWSNEQIINKRCDRVVIAMPTRFTSNALKNAIEEFVEDVNVQHSSSRKFYNNLNDYKWSRSLQSSVTVSTIDHLLNAMSLSKEEHQHILFNLVNSCVVIDEADFYDSFILGTYKIFTFF